MDKYRLNLNKECPGLCLTAYDIGLDVSGIAYPHPACPVHGDPDRLCVACFGYGSIPGDPTMPPGIDDTRICDVCGGAGAI